MADEKELVHKIKRRQVQMEDRRQYWESDWSVIAEYVQPRREFESGEFSEIGFRQGTEMYDGTAAGALRLMADGYLGYMTSPTSKWFKMRFWDERLERIATVKRWEWEVENLMYSALQRSNFYESMHAYFIDGGSIGTATMYIEEDVGEGKIVYSVRHPIEVFIEQNRYGKIDTVHRKFLLPARETVKMFDESKLSDKAKKAATERPDEDIEFLHCTGPNDEKVYGKADNNNMDIYSYYIETTGADVLLQSSGYNSNPYAVWRYRTNTNERYGRSPSHDALVDIMGLNQMSKDILHMSHIQADPPMLAPGRMRGDLELSPGVINWYEDKPGEIRPLFEGSAMPLALDREQAKQQAIREHFRVEFFLMLASAERQMTATEIIERQGEKAAVLGATIKRLESECLDPVLDRTFWLEFEGGRLPPPPGVVLDQIGGKEMIKFDYIGPLAQAQERNQGTAITRAFERVAPFMQIYPNLRHVFDEYELVKEVLESSGFPATAVREKKQYQGIVAAEAKKAEQIQKTQQIAEASKAVPNLSKAAEPGSLLEELEGQAVEALGGGG